TTTVDLGARMGPRRPAPTARRSRQSLRGGPVQPPRRHRRRSHGRARRPRGAGMTRLAAIVVAFAVTLGVLIVLEDDVRVWWFRGVVTVVGIGVVRALWRWHAAHPPSPIPSRRARRRWRRP